VHEQLDKIGPVRLIRRQIEDQLHGSADSIPVLGNQDRSTSLGEALGNAAPEAFGRGEVKGGHEPHRRTIAHAIDQHV
jgi:hypothetical protein